MHLKKSYRLLILCIALLSATGCAHHPSRVTSTIILTNSSGQTATEFDVMDAVYGSFFKLKPGEHYTIRILENASKEISRSSFTANKKGIIPTTALWWDIGATYAKSRTGQLHLQLSRHRYSVTLNHKGRIIASQPFRIRPATASPPLVFTSDQQGNPLNGFVNQKESVYLTGRNLPPGSKLRINIVRGQYHWEPGMRLTSARPQPVVLQLAKNQQNFTTLIWSANNSQIGSYDVVAEYQAANAVYDRFDLIDSHYGVGFVYFAPTPQPPAPPVHIETDLACQAPPQDPNTGNVIGAPNPIYKDQFSPVEEVWVAVNPHAGGGNYVGQTARLYVVDHLPASGWTNGKTLTDKSSDNYEVAVVQPGCANVNYTKVWSNPSIGDYDVVVDFAPFGVYNVGTDIIDKLNAKGFYVPSQWVCLESVSFNHQSSSNHADALNIRMNKTVDVMVPEWQKAKKTYPAAYIKSKTVTVKAVFTAGSGVNSCKIKAMVDYGQLGAVQEKTVTFTNGNSGAVSFNLTLSTPNQIKSFIQKWKWSCSDINGSASAATPIAATKNRIYIVLAEPPSPWTTSGQSEPWADVLKWACWWATGETTQVGAAEEIQHHLYNDLKGSYDYGPQYTSWTTQPFDMTNFLSNMTTAAGIGLVNCYDMGKSLVSFSNVLGCNLTYKLSKPFGSLNCEKAIGKPWNCSEAFGNHGFGNIGNNVTDACLKIDSDNTPTSAPHTETWLTNIPWNTYNTMVVINATASTPVPYTFDVQ